MTRAKWLKRLHRLSLRELGYSLVEHGLTFEQQYRAGKSPEEVLEDEISAMNDGSIWVEPAESEASGA